MDIIGSIGLLKGNDLVYGIRYLLSMSVFLLTREDWFQTNLIFGIDDVPNCGG